VVPKTINGADEQQPATTVGWCRPSSPVERRRPEQWPSPPAAMWIDKSMRPPLNEQPRRNVSGCHRTIETGPVAGPTAARAERVMEKVEVNAQRDQRPDPEKDSAVIGDPTADKPRPPHVDDKDAQPTDRPEGA